MVDTLVSNTSGASRVGSNPSPGTTKEDTLIRGDICMASSEPNFSFTWEEDEVWEEIDERLWETRLYQSEHYHDENLDVACDRENPVEDHEVARMVMVRSIEGDIAQVFLFELARNDWDFDASALSKSDIYLDSSTTGLTHSFIAQTGISFPVYLHQLSRPVLTVPAEFCDKIEDLATGGNPEGLKVGAAETNSLSEWKAVEAHDADKMGKLVRAA